MGHLVNPIALRLSINNSWNSNWSQINNFNYNNLFKKDYLLYIYLDSFIRKKNFMFNTFIISNYKIFRINEKNYLNIYYYFPYNEDIKYRLYRNFLFKMRWRKKHFFRKKMYKPIFQKKISRLNSRKKLKYIIKYILKKIFSYIFFFLMQKYLNYYLKKLDIPKIKLNVYKLHKRGLTSEIVTLYISYRLQQKYSLRWILKPVLKDLDWRLKKKMISGYKLLCAGRFTKRQIATYMWYRKGSLPLNTINTSIKYSQSKVRLKFGLGGIKLWIHSGLILKPRRYMSLIYPKYTPLKFFFKDNFKSIIFCFNYWSWIYLNIFSLKDKKKNIFFSYIRMLILRIISYAKNMLSQDISSYAIKILNNNKLLICLKDKKTIKLSPLKLKYIYI